MQWQLHIRGHLIHRYIEVKYGVRVGLIGWEVLLILILNMVVVVGLMINGDARVNVRCYFS